MPTNTSYRLEFKINELPKTTNSQNSMHWTAKKKYVNYWHSLVWAHVSSHKPPLPLAKAKLTLTRISSHEPDFDGLVSSFKHVIDGLITAKIIENDKMSNIGQSRYLWIKGKRKEGRIEVIVESIPG